MPIDLDMREPTSESSEIEIKDADVGVIYEIVSPERNAGMVVVRLVEMEMVTPDGRHRYRVKTHPDIRLRKPPPGTQVILTQK